VVAKDFPDLLSFWVEVYFRYEVTTSERSQKEQRRDLNIFLQYIDGEVGNTLRSSWTPRLSDDFIRFMQSELNADSGKRRWGDRVINRTLAHLKSFARWVHKWRPFELGEPMAKIRMVPVASLLDIEKALTKSERRDLLDAADLLVVSGGLFRNRRLHKNDSNRQKRKGYRAFRNRAIVYSLIETGMRRTAVVKLNLDDVDFDNRSLKVLEKGGITHSYKISREGLQAIRDYLECEREGDSEKWQNPALFLSARTTAHGDGRLQSKAVNEVWNQICEKAGVKGKTPHSARHAMGRHIIEKTGNVAAVQRQLGHKNPVYSMQYSRITTDELDQVINDR
jgi:site-specific recombinase XerD